MKRSSDQPDQDGKNDLERAQQEPAARARHRRRLHAGVQPARPLLPRAGEGEGRAGRAGRAASAGGSRSSGAQARRASTSSSSSSRRSSARRRIRKNPNYAPIHNTAGLIQVELRNFNGAVKSFGRARQLDPKFFEAQMNYAAVNLSFRGFERGREGVPRRRSSCGRTTTTRTSVWRSRSAVRSTTRTSTRTSPRPQTRARRSARRSTPDRAETYYNEAILTQEYKAKAAAGRAMPMLEQGREAVSSSSSPRPAATPEFADAVKRSKERMQDIDDTIKFIKEGEAQQKRRGRRAAAGRRGRGGAAPAEGAAASRRRRGRREASGRRSPRGAPNPAVARRGRSERAVRSSEACLGNLSVRDGVCSSRTSAVIARRMVRRLTLTQVCGEYNVTVIQAKDSEEAEMDRSLRLRVAVAAVAFGVRAAFALPSRRSRRTRRRGRRRRATRATATSSPTIR